MAYINKIVVNGSEVNANQLEGVLDKDGHNRFIEGNLIPETVSGVSPSYYKWSLSGTHLMIVFVFEADTNIASETTLATINVPTWILNKIQAIASGTTVVTYKEVIGRTFGTAENYQKDLFVLIKDDGQLQIISSAITVPGTSTVYRIQFDLLIDNA